MTPIKSYGKTLILAGVILFLCVPIAQKLFQFKKHIKPLEGSYVTVKDTVFTLNGWMDGRYQETKNKYLAQHYGLRNYFVRLNNQIRYSLFDLTSIHNVIVGKEGFMYETEYIDAYYGNDFIGAEKLTQRYTAIKKLQDQLAGMGIDLEVVFAPSKAAFYPEYIPDDYVTEKKQTNYDYAIELCKRLNINHVDFNAWFKELKSKMSYGLYPKTGIHWSTYGSLLAADSLKKHIEFNTHFNLKDLEITKVNYSDSLIHPDNDMGRVMNLLLPVNAPAMPYADYYWKPDDSTTVQPNALFVSDSYFFQIYSQGLSSNFFSNTRYWYYNTTVYPETEAVRDVNKLNIVEEIKKQKVIVLMATEMNVQEMGWGFAERALDELNHGDAKALRRKAFVNSIKDEIKNTPEWMGNIKRKALERKISEAEMIEQDAVYIYEQDYSKPEVTEKIEKAKTRILNTKEWVEQINQKAKERNISFEEMLEIDTKYLYDTEYRNKP